jgi:hypothetical protein
MEHGSSPDSCAGSLSQCEHNNPAPRIHAEARRQLASKPEPNDNVCAPATVNGFRVLAAVRLTDGPGLVPNGHVVICEQKPGRYVTWLTGNETGAWTVQDSGHYDLAWDRALADMTARALLWDSSRKAL